MSASTETPAAGTAGGGASIPDGGAAASPNGAGTATQVPGTSGAPASGDYAARIRAGGDFAESEVKTHQSRGDKAEAQSQKDRDWMGTLEQYRDRFTGNDVVQHLSDLNRILESELGDQAKSFLQTGEVPASAKTANSDASDEEYQTPEEKEIASLRSQLQSVESRLGRQESGSGAQALKQHVEGFFRQWPLGDDVVDRVKGKLIDQVRSWATQGEAGRKALDNLMSPNGAATVSTLALQQLSEVEQETAIDNRRLRKSQGLNALSTGGPSVTPGSGGEPPPSFKTSVEAIEWAEAHPEGHNSS